MTSVANLKLSGSDDEGAGGANRAPSTPGSQDVTAASSPMDHATLLVAVRKQVEYYFSKENLERDAYLTSQMDANNSVPISVVMKFSKMKSLVAGDEAIVREALLQSAVCSVAGDDSRIRALVKAGGRSTIILRDIPSDTAEAAVREIFNFDAMKGRNISSIRPDIENTWFVVLDTETAAKDTLLDLKLKRRMFNGESVKARLKTEVALRSFYSQPPPVPVPAMGGYGGVPMAPYGAYGPNGSPVGGSAPVFGYPMVQQIDPSQMGGPVPIPANGSVPYGAPMDGSVMHDGSKQAGKHTSRGKEGDRGGVGSRTQQQGQQLQQQGRSQTDGSRGLGQPGSAQGGRPSANAKGSPNGRTGGATAGGAGSDRQGGSARGQTKGAKGAAGAVAKQTGGHVPVDLNLQNFPPLHVDETPTPLAGYQGPYHKYSQDDIIGIVSKMKEAPMPMYALNGLPLNPSDHGHAMTATPNNDLLRRQRSFSIDETREQLQQGKPVHREAVAAGAVDYASMTYGDVRTSSIDETGLRDAIVTPSDAAPAPVRSAPGSAPGSAPRSRSNSYQQGHKNQNHGNKSQRGEQPRGANAVPSASSWAALVKSSSTSSTQTEPNSTKSPASPARNTDKAAKDRESKISSNTNNSKGTSVSNKDSERAPASKDGKGRNARQPRKEEKVRPTIPQLLLALYYAPVIYFPPLCVWCVRSSMQCGGYAMTMTLFVNRLKEQSFLLCNMYSYCLIAAESMHAHTHLQSPLPFDAERKSNLPYPFLHSIITIRIITKTGRELRLRCRRRRLGRKIHLCQRT